MEVVVPLQTTVAEAEAHWMPMEAVGEAVREMSVR